MKCVVSYNFHSESLTLLSLSTQVGIHYLDKLVFIASNHTHRRKDLIAIRNLNVNFYRLKKNLNVRTVHMKASVRIIYDSTCSNILNTQKILWKLKVVDSKYTLDEHYRIVIFVHIGIFRDFLEKNLFGKLQLCHKFYVRNEGNHNACKKIGTNCKQIGFENLCQMKFFTKCWSWRWCEHQTMKSNNPIVLNIE